VAGPREESWPGAFDLRPPIVLSPKEAADAAAAAAGTGAPAPNPTTTCAPGGAPAATALDEHWRNFVRNLPLETFALGQVIRLRERPGNRVGVKVSPDPDAEAHGCPGHLAASTDEVRALVAYYLKTPVGPRVLTMGDNQLVNLYRLHVFRAALDAWRHLIGPRDKSGRLLGGMRCIHLITGETRSEWRIWKCNNLTRDPCGLCHRHKKPGALTLLNDGILEYIRTAEAHEAPEAVQARRDAEQERCDADRAKRNAERDRREAKREAERGRREAKWRDIAAGIHYGATNRQIYLLLDLGTGPEQLEGIGKAEASGLIDRLLRSRSEGVENGTDPASAG
jgi:hypothetical protein